MSREAGASSGPQFALSDAEGAHGKFVIDESYWQFDGTERPLGPAGVAGDFDPADAARRPYGVRSVVSRAVLEGKHGSASDLASTRAAAASRVGASADAVIDVRAQRR